MDMQVEAQLIRKERLKRAWSQEQLAQVSGLGIRTVQRIESGGNASLETIKALSAVLEIPVESLLADVSAPLASPPFPSRPSLFKPWRAFAAGCLTTLITMGSFVSMQGVMAEEIAMDFAFSMNDEELANSRVKTDAGTETVVRIDNGIRIHFTPSITDKGDILIDMKIYQDGKDGEPQPLAMPKLLTENGREAVLRVGKQDDNGHFKGIALEVTPTIE
jgi:transcriptional regulator with XRE-family HTH domain